MQGVKTKAWADALRRVGQRESAGKGSAKRIDKVAEKVFDLAGKGDISAIQEIGNRLDGRPHVTAEVTQTIRDLRPEEVIAQFSKAATDLGADPLKLLEEAGLSADMLAQPDAENAEKAEGTVH